MNTSSARAEREMYDRYIRLVHKQIDTGVRTNKLLEDILKEIRRTNGVLAENVYKQSYLNPDQSENLFDISEGPLT